jgi:DNA modification methylase
MKPVELVERAVRNSSRRRDTVLDPFGGAGSTLIACEKNRRQARLIEIDAQYVDVTVQRWQNFTGLQATLAGDGRTFAEIARERVPATTTTDQSTSGAVSDEGRAQ